LDNFGTFAEKDSTNLTEMLNEGLLAAGDFLLITSCLSPRIVHQPSFMAAFKTAFGIFYDGVEIDRDFKARNHVDILVALAFSRYHTKMKSIGKSEFLYTSLIRKFSYRDSKATMGLWVFRVARQEAGSFRLSDCEFEQFPHAFTKPKATARAVPNIFE